MHNQNNTSNTFSWNSTSGLYYNHSHKDPRLPTYNTRFINDLNYILKCNNSSHGLVSTSNQYITSVTWWNKLGHHIRRKISIIKYYQPVLLNTRYPPEGRLSWACLSNRNPRVQNESKCCQRRCEDDYLSDISSVNLTQIWVFPVSPSPQRRQECLDGNLLSASRTKIFLSWSSTSFCPINSGLEFGLRDSRISFSTSVW